MDKNIKKFEDIRQNLPKILHSEELKEIEKILRKWQVTKRLIELELDISRNIL